MAVSQRSSLPRIAVTVFATGLVSFALMIVQWMLASFITLGTWTEARWGSHSLKSLGVVFVPVDFLLWFASLWGVQNLWRRLHAEVEERERTKTWPHTLRSVGTWANAALCALPFSYYVVFGVTILFNQGGPPWAVSSFIGAMLISLAACAGMISLLFDIAVRVWPARSKR